ncbi:PAS domain S-box protein [Bacteroidota bacterium]
MKKADIKSNPSTLRQKAEKALKKRSSKAGSKLSETEMHAIIHELEVHQVELEMMNEELALANKKAEETAEKYTELYDSAPTGYFTLSRNGKIIGLNLHASQMLGKERKHLINSQLGFFLSDDTQPTFRFFLKTVFSSKTNETCEVTLLTNENIPMCVHISGIVNENGEYCFLTVEDITECKSTEEKLRESEERYRVIFQRSVTGILIADSETRAFLFSNPAICQMFGYSEEEFKLLSVENIHPQEALDSVISVFDSMLQGEESVAYALPCLRKEGTIFYADISGTPTIINGQTCVIGFFTDVTDRKKAEDKSILLQSAVESTSDAIGISDAEGHHIYQNNAFSDLFEYSTAQELEAVGGGKAAAKDLETAKEMYQHIMSGKSYAGEWEMVKKSGEVFTGYGRTDAIKDSDGNIIGIIGIIEDISERKQNEEALLASEERYRTLTENVGEGVCFIDENETFIYANSSAEKLYGVGKGGLLGLNLLDFIHEKDIDLINNETLKRSQGKKSVYEHEIVLKDGSKKDLLITATPKFDNKKFSGTIAIFRDISKLKEAELQLVRAKELAEKNDQLKTVFLETMSHEIRTPMNGILGFVQLLGEAYITKEEQQKYLSTIAKNGDRLLNVVTNIVSFSKIESGQMEVLISRTNVNEALNSIYHFFKTMAEEKGLQISLNTSLSANQSFVMTDQEKVHAILAKLVRDAIKYTREGSIEFGCKKKGKFLEFFVKDTGEGIPEDKREVIFERFRQASEGHARNHTGAGLGLTISKAYVEKLGGKIWVESEVGKGSTFYFTIPFNAGTDMAPVPKKDSSESGAEQENRKLNILIVEDDESSNLFLSTALHSYYREIYRAMTGTEAVEICQRTPDIDLVMMDINLPELDGYEATRQIRKFNKDVIIIAQTAYGLPGDMEKALEAGCNDYMSKPINFKLMKEVIQKYLR